MRVDLILQRCHASVQEKPFLFFELDLDAHAVPNLQFSSNRDNRSGINRDPDSWIKTFTTKALERESGVRKESRQLRLHEPQRYDRHKKQDLPIEQPRCGKVAADHSVN